MNSTIATALMLYDNKTIRFSMYHIEAVGIVLLEIRVSSFKEHFHTLEFQ